MQDFFHQQYHKLGPDFFWRGNSSLEVQKPKKHLAPSTCQLKKKTDPPKRLLSIFQVSFLFVVVMFFAQLNVTWERFPKRSKMELLTKTARRLSTKRSTNLFGASVKSHNRAKLPNPAVLFMSSSSYLKKKLAFLGGIELHPPTESTNLMNACRIHIHVYYTHIYICTHLDISTNKNLINDIPYLCRIWLFIDRLPNNQNHPKSSPWHCGVKKSTADCKEQWRPTSDRASCLSTGLVVPGTQEAKMDATRDISWDHNMITWSS